MTKLPLSLLPLWKTGLSPPPKGIVRLTLPHVLKKTNTPGVFSPGARHAFARTPEKGAGDGQACAFGPSKPCGPERKPRDKDRKRVPRSPRLRAPASSSQRGLKHKTHKRGPGPAAPGLFNHGCSRRFVPHLSLHPLLLRFVPHLSLHLLLFGYVLKRSLWLPDLSRNSESESFR